MIIHHPQQREGARDRGFTLVELLVVITVLGVLAAVVVFRVGGITSTGKKSACELEIREVNTAIQAYRAQGNPYPTTLTAVGTALVPVWLEAMPGPNTAVTNVGVYTYTAGPPTNGVFSATCPTG
jgi:prepilin-type N-terminal cleavage/methylation domain-containing protein